VWALVITFKGLVRPGSSVLHKTHAAFKKITILECHADATEQVEWA